MMMATKKTGGSTKNGRDSDGRRLGLKVGNLESVHVGSILIRQRGKKYKCGKNASMGSDHTIYAAISGKVHFYKKQNTTFVSVINLDNAI